MDNPVDKDETPVEVDVERETTELDNEVACDALVESSVDNPVDKDETPVEVDVERETTELDNEVS